MKNDQKITKNEENKDKDEKNLQAENDKLTHKLTEFENNYMRALADYQNLQKRTLEEKQNWIKAANKDLILRLLPILDTLMLAQKHIQNDGLKVAIDQFLEALKNEGVKPINALNQDFDPNLMECVTIQEGEEGKVLEELRAGYIINNKVLRAAQVKVGSKAKN